MKKILFFAVITVFFACKQEEKTPDYTLFEGAVINSDAEQLTISGYSYKEELPISQTGVFMDTLRIAKNGYYTFSLGGESTSIYLEQGKALKINLDANQFDESIKYSGTLASENNYLAAKYMWNENNFDAKEIFSKKEQEFLTTNTSMQKAYDSLMKTNNVENKDFIASEKSEIAYSRAANIENYQNYHRYFSGDQTFTVSPSFYENVKGIDFADTTVYKNSNTYQQLISSHYQRLADMDAAKDDTTDLTIAYLERIDKSLPNGDVKNSLMRESLQYGMTANSSLDNVYTIYKNTNPKNEDLEPITKRYNLLKTLQQGMPSPTFDYENHKGGKTAIESLKGKYTYIDVWATWCGPCIREIPALKKVEEEYKDKNINFVSISIDVEKDHDKWKNMVNDKALGGIQLMADNNWKSKFIEDYGINGIPRFILLDPQGNIVSADAPRPSDSKLATLLNSLL